jgi:hypothetical protein
MEKIPHNKKMMVPLPLRLHQKKIEKNKRKNLVNVIILNL